MKNLILSALLVLVCLYSYSACSETIYVHSDVLGSPIMETNSSGTVTSRSHYKPFGEALEGMKKGVGYTGHLNDKDLKLTYMQARYYDPVIGRFYSNDPVGFTGDVHSFGRYTYVNNNPYKYTDPNGESPLHILAAVVGAVVSGTQTYISTGGDVGKTLKSAVIGGASAALSLSPAGLLSNVGRSFAVGAVTDATTQVVVDGKEISEVDPMQSIETGAKAAVSTLIGGTVASKVPVQNFPSVKGPSVPPGRTPRITAHAGTIKSDKLKQGVAGVVTGGITGTLLNIDDK